MPETNAQETNWQKFKRWPGKKWQIFKSWSGEKWKGVKKWFGVLDEKEYLSIDESTYNQLFGIMDSEKSGISVEDTKTYHALKAAHEIRKFELELYWKRATYFWTFIAVIFAGFFAVSNLDDNVSGKNDLIMIACSLGTIFSLSWYFVNRGSKYWVQNWEKHIDMLENDITGPLYKTKIVQGGRWRHMLLLNSAFPFSVSKINQMTSLFIAIAWLIMLLNQAANMGLSFWFFKPIVTYFQTWNHANVWLWLPLVYLIFLLYFGRAGGKKLQEAHKDPSKTGFKKRVHNF